MRYYFSAQTSNISPFTKDRYQSIISLLANMGHENINYVHMPDNNKQKKEAYKVLATNKISAFDYQINILENSDALICDMTEHSETVGYQIYYAISKKIPVLVLYFKQKGPKEASAPSVIFTGNNKGLLKLATINKHHEIEEAVVSFVNDFVNKPYKFNFFIPLNLYNGLNRLAIENNKTKSELIREAIEDLVNDPNGVVNKLNIQDEKIH